jgi:hypothetical protein
MHDLSERETAARREADALARKIAEIEASISWRLTKPMRGLRSLLRRAD